MARVHLSQCTDLAHSVQHRESAERLVQRLEGKMTPRQVELLLEFQKEALKVRVCSNAAATLRVCFPTHVDRRA